MSSKLRRCKQQFEGCRKALQILKRDYKEATRAIYWIVQNGAILREKQIPPEIARTLHTIHAEHVAKLKEPSRG